MLRVRVPSSAPLRKSPVLATGLFPFSVTGLEHRGGARRSHRPVLRTVGRRAGERLCRDAGALHARRCPVFRSITKKSRPCDGAFSVQCDGTRTPRGREAFPPTRPADGRSPSGRAAVPRCRRLARKALSRLPLHYEKAPSLRQGFVFLFSQQSSVWPTSVYCGTGLCQIVHRRSMRQPTTQPTKVDTSATGMAYRRRLSSMRDV